MLKPVIAGPVGAAAGSTERTPSVRWALAGLSLSMLLSSLGTSIANVGLPTLAQAFAASFQEVQWVVLAYLLAITALIVSVGRLGDITGRRRLLLAGIILFTAASVLCGVAPTLWLLIAARAAQGLGAAIMMALTIAFVGETVPKEKTGSAMGLLGTMSAIGTALGPSLGGVLIAGFGWRSCSSSTCRWASWRCSSRYRCLPADRKVSKTDRASFDQCGYAAARADARRLCARHDDGARQFRLGQHGHCSLAAAFGVGMFVLAETESCIAAGPFGDVPQSGTERGLRHERPGHDRGDGDAGGGPLLSVRRACARRSPRRTRHVVRSDCRCADGCAGRPPRGPVRRTAA